MPIRYTHRIFIINLFSFPAYMAINNILLFSLFIMIGIKTELRIFGSFCEPLNPIAFTYNNLLLYYLFLIVKIGLFCISIIVILKNQNFNSVKFMIAILILNSIIIDGFGFISTGIDALLNLYTYKYFFSGATIYLLEVYLNPPFYLFSFMLLFAGFVAVVIVLKVVKSLSIVNVLLYYASIIISILAIAVAFVLYKSI